jgi:DNA-3-methyladenine glycosylase II
MLATANLHTITGALTPRPPFDFAKTHSFLRGFSPTAGEQTLTVDAVTKAVTIQGRAVAFELRGEGTIEAPRIAYTLYSERLLSQEERAIAEDRIRFFLSLDDDLQPFYALGRADPVFAPVIERFYGLHQPKFLTPFEIACWAVLGQRIPMRIAHRVKLALVERWGTSITLPDGETYRAFPEPAQLAAVAPDDLLAVVRNERKVEYLQAVIQFFSEVDESFLRSGPHDEVVARLCGIRGIGEWSLHFILVRGLGRMERVSAADRELLKAASKLYNQGQPLDAQVMQRLLDYYGPTQGYWAYYTRISAMDTFQEMGM